MRFGYFLGRGRNRQEAPYFGSDQGPWRYTNRALFARSQGTVLAAAVIEALASLVADLHYNAVDPRTRVRS